MIDSEADDLLNECRLDTVLNSIVHELAQSPVAI